MQRELSTDQANEVKEGLVEVLVLQKEFAEALALLEDGPSFVPGKPKMLACRAESLWGLGRGGEAKALLDKKPNPTEHDVRLGLAGNLCRCTGYDKIVRAVLDAAK